MPIIAPTAACSAAGPRPTRSCDHHAETAGAADAAHGRRRDDEHQRFLDRRKLGEQRRLDGCRRHVRILGALLERLQHDENRAGVGGVGARRARKADDVDGVRDARDRRAPVSTARRLTASVRASEAAGGSCITVIR